MGVFLDPLPRCLPERAFACQRRHRFDDGIDDERVQSGHGENQCSAQDAGDMPLGTSGRSVDDRV
jgi:hypothetical protein